MACKENAVSVVDPHQLASLIRTNRLDKVLIVDSRSFLEYNDLHVQGAVNVCCSKLVKRRLQQDKVCVRDFLLQNCRLERGLVDESGDVIVYDQSSVNPSSVSPDSFLHVLLCKLVHVFRRVFLLSGGFLEFQARHGDLCEDKSRLLRSATLNMTSLSQPCLPITNVGPTRILPFLYLGSQQDAHNRELLADYNITFEVNVSTNCPQPDFIQDSHFLRLPVNDSYGEKLLPYFVRATHFIDKVRESNGSVLVHCLAGISRSPTVAIAYVMRHLQMTFDDAFRYVKSKRSSISPNFNFLGQLLEYERQLRAEEVLDSSVGDVSCLPPVSASPRCLLPSSNNNSPAPQVGGRERLSRSISLSLSLKTPVLETVPPSCSPSPDHVLQSSPFGFGLDQVDSGSSGNVQRPITADLSPTTALARLSFEGLDSQPDEEIKESSSSYLSVSRRKHTREESYRSLRQRLSTSSSSSSSESHFYSSKQKTETSSRSSSSMVLTVSQSQRVTSSNHCPLAGLASRNRWKPPPSPNHEPLDTSAAAPSSHCSEISVQIEESATGSDGPVTEEEEMEVEIRRRGPGFPRPHSDGGYRHPPVHHHHHPLHHTRSVPRRPSYAASETCSSIHSDDLLLPPTPSSPPPSHCLSSPQTWGCGLYARSDSVTTSGLGSEISDSDTRADDALSLCSGSTRCFGAGGSVPSEEAETESLPPDDGVFTEPLPPVRFQPPVRSSRPRPSSLLGITPARDLEWKPNTCSTNIEDGVDSSPFGLFPPLRKARPTSLLNPLVLSSSPLSTCGTASDVNPLASNDSAEEPGEDLPDSATVFRLWRQREAAMEQQSDRCDSSSLLSMRRRSSKELAAPPAGRLQSGETSSKRKSSEIPEGSDSPPAVVEKRRSTREVGDSDRSVEDGLYRVMSCPDIVDQLNEADTLPKSIHLELELSTKGRHQVQLRVRSAQSRRDSHTQRYSCGALDGKVAVDPATPPNSASPTCGSRQNSNPSLNCNSFSVIEVS